MAIVTLFGKMEIVPICDEKQGYRMAYFTLFGQNEIVPIFDEIQGCSKAVL